MPAPKPLTCIALGLIAASVSLIWLWGFTVDDALITARVAHQLASGHGYRFNPSGPIVDAVTPLGFAFVLVPFAAAGPLAAHAAAKWLGVFAWLFGVALLSRRLATLQPRGATVGLLLLSTTIPLATWAVAGMETGVVLGLATVGFLHPNWAGRIALGVAAAWRPELLAWTLVVGAGHAFVGGGSAQQRSRRVAMALVPLLLPFALVAIIRSSVFGAAYPLAVLAKPSDSGSGLRYALGALAFSGPAWGVVGLGTLRRLSPFARVLVVAALVHVFVLILVGGDWMPFYRLFAPILPSLIYAAAELAQDEPLYKTCLRIGVALSASALLALGRSRDARGVETQRAELILRTRPLLAGAQRIASLDIGWVGASTSAHIVDLAGVTDPTVARLPGGHTTKRLPDSFIESRELDAMVLLVDNSGLEHWPNRHFARRVEAHLLTLTGAEAFTPVGLVPLLGTRQAYVVARKLKQLHAP
ncbi:MAG: hypothetical protein ACOY0T_40640 [Myxococcota bacterium]